MPIESSSQAQFKGEAEIEKHLGDDFPAERPDRGCLGWDIPERLKFGKEAKEKMANKVKIGEYFCLFLTQKWGLRATIQSVKYL